MTGWFFYQPVSNVTQPLQCFKTGDKEVVVVYNHSGNVFLLDRKGNTRASWKQLYVAKNSSFSLVSGDSLQEDHLVTTDTSGTIVSLYLNGTLKTKTFGKHSPEHSFQMADVDGDGKKDFAFLDFRQVQALKQDGAVIYKHAFPLAMNPELYTFPFTNNFQQLAAGSDAENKFYVLNKDGIPSNGFPVKGSRATATNDWGAESKRILVTAGKDGSVYLYIID